MVSLNDKDHTYGWMALGKMFPQFFNNDQYPEKVQT